MTTTTNHEQTERTQASTGQLTDAERKLVTQIDEQASDQKPKRSLSRRKLSQPLVIY